MNATQRCLGTPGSAEKIQALQDRVSQEVELWNPQDAKGYGGPVPTSGGNLGKRGWAFAPVRGPFDIAPLRDMCGEDEPATEDAMTAREFAIWRVEVLGPAPRPWSKR